MDERPPKQMKGLGRKLMSRRRHLSLVDLHNMALSLDDKLLGEKTHYYCSSSEGEDGSEDEGGSDDEDGGEKGAARNDGPASIPEPQLKKYTGRSTNTGPKGVIEDWRRYKQLETEKRREQEVERIELLKKLSLTCRTENDEEAERAKDQQFLEQISEFEDEFLKEYRLKRIEEMRRAVENIPKFGKVVSLSKDSFVDAIDKEKAGVTVIVHIYEDNVSGCAAMDGCLACLAQEYLTVKFCRIKASDARLSYRFAESGCPALLAYKNGELIGNFIRMSDDLSEDFFATDVESFLLEHGILPDKTTCPTLASSQQAAEDDSDSDFDVD